MLPRGRVKCIAPRHAKIKPREIPMNAYAPAATDVRSDWTREEIGALFALPFSDLLYRAQTLHRAYHKPNEVQISTLLSIKTGGCPEDCGYCSQSASHETGLKASKLMDVDA